MTIARKAVESIFILMQFSKENKGDFSPVHDSDKWKYLTKNVMGLPCLDRSNSASCSVQDEEIWSYFHSNVRYNKLLEIKYKFISAMKDILFFSKKCGMY